MGTRVSEHYAENNNQPVSMANVSSAAVVDTDSLIEGLQSENDTLRAEVARLRQYRMLAYRDPLTGLRNRRYFDERLGEECDRAQRSADARLSLLVIDIDDFKRINDSEGHVAGDRALQWVANFLNQNLRAHDICCRTGGDEFMAILANAEKADCEIIKQRIERNLAKLTEDMPHALSLSIGFSTWPDDGGCSESLIKSADQDMYQEKQTRVRTRTADLYPLSFAH
jgi:diguanylate cyclase (GGDEF)-like protein